MRKYQPIWEQVKASPDLSASLIAPKPFHLKIIRAVRKEKNKDLGYKLVCSEIGIRYKLMEKIRGKEIRFYLVDVTPDRVDINDL